MISTLIFLLADALSMLCWTRLLLQWAQLPYMHPLAQFCLLSTNWLIQPLRKIIPSWRRWDMACVMGSVLIYYLASLLNILLLSAQWAISLRLMAVMLFISLLLALRSLCYVLIMGLLLRMVLSFSQAYNPLLQALQRLFMPLTRPLFFLRWRQYDFSGTFVVILLWLAATLWLPHLLNLLQLSLLTR
ncbi:YggT family protein [Neisseriaceae bacterium ESL0693]|nr:YggT family protein [Neisseriaceae bacterium ESL0693]